MAIDPPYRLDPLQNVVNVKWGTPSLTVAWQFVAEFGNSGEFDCPQGPFATTISTTSFTVTLVPLTPPPGFSISGSPSGGGAITVGPGSYATLLFLPDSKSGNGPGSATFQVMGRTCGSNPTTELVGSLSVSIPAVTITDIEGTGEGTVYELFDWTATAAAGINVAATFVLSDE